MWDRSKDWPARKGTKVEPSTTYQPQMDGQSEIANRTILQATWGCKDEENH